MMRSISCFSGTMLIGCALVLAPLTAHTEEPDQKTEENVVIQLFRRDYPTTNYASYVLEVRSRSEVEVRAYIDLRQDSKKLASIPLLPSYQKDMKGGQSTFLRVNCVALDGISDTSFFYIFLTEPGTGRAIKETRVLLSSAKSVTQLPGAGPNKAANPTGGEKDEF